MPPRSRGFYLAIAPVGFQILRQRLVSCWKRLAINFLASTRRI